MSSIRFTTLSEGACWADMTLRNVMYCGTYRGYDFEIVFRLDQCQWGDSVHKMPDDVFKTLKSELSLRDSWLPDDELPA